MTTALSLLIDLPELGEANKKEIAALVGIALMTRESGKWIGQAKIRDGRAPICKILYMSALVAVMRRMIVILNAMMDSRRCYQD